MGWQRSQSVVGIARWVAYIAAYGTFRAAAVIQSLVTHFAALRAILRRS